ncbi:Polyadenylate-binding protein-interacting protein 10, partial [Zea mays]
YKATVGAIAQNGYYVAYDGWGNREECSSGANFSSIVQVTEENLATELINCRHVVDYRMCGDPNSVLRFAFIEFADEEGARAAPNLSRTVLGYYPVNVLPSKTAIAPVNETFLPRSDDEREMCASTIYCTNIDKKVTQADLNLFFESICGEVGRSLLQTQSPFCTAKSLQKWHHQDRSGDQQDHGLHQV